RPSTTKREIVGVIHAQHVADVVAAQTALRPQIIDFLYWSGSAGAHFSRLEIGIALGYEFGVSVGNLHLKPFREPSLKRHQQTVVPGLRIRLCDVDSLKGRIEFLCIRGVLV